jgi:hypothetical protein
MLLAASGNIRAIPARQPSGCRATGPVAAARRHPWQPRPAALQPETGKVKNNATSSTESYCRISSAAFNFWYCGVPGCSRKALAIASRAPGKSWRSQRTSASR